MIDRYVGRALTHAKLGATLFPKISGLDAAAAAEETLATSVVLPAAARFLVVQDHVPQFVLTTRPADHRPNPAAGFSAGCTA